MTSSGVDVSEEQLRETIENILSTPIRRAPVFANETRIQAEESFELPRRRTACTWSGRDYGKLFSALVFLICATCFLWQSLAFYQLYYSYPTTTNMAVITPSRFMKPAFTFCNSSPVDRSRFCKAYPHLCEKPDNLPEFCQKHSHFCQKNASNLVIPKLGYYTWISHDDFGPPTSKLVFNRAKDKVRYFSSGREKTKKVFFTSDVLGKVIFKCHSANLHLTSDEEPKTVKIEQNVDEELRSDIDHFWFEWRMKASETFFPWDEPKVYFSIHSPFVPSNPFDEADFMTVGNSYLIDVRLEEEHLLPHPYPTDCVDYGVLWRKNNKTGPRSQKMCMVLCSRSYREQCCSCENFFLSHRLPECECFCDDDEMCENIDELWENYLECSENCKQDCVKSKYRYTIKKQDTRRDWYHSETSKDTIYAQIQTTNMEVIVTTHNALYHDGDLFSYIGGLMGCWLGISVWAFAGFFESTLRKTLQLANGLRKKKKRQPFPMDTSYDRQLY